MIIFSTVVLVNTWTMKHEIAPHLRFYITIMASTSVARVFSKFYCRRWPLAVVTEEGEEVLRPIDSFCAKLAVFIRDNVDKICLISLALIIFSIDKTTSKSAEEKIPLLLWTGMIWMIIYVIYFIGPLFFVLCFLACLPCIILIMQRFFALNFFDLSRNPRTQPASQEVLDKIWKVKYVSDDSFRYVNPENLEQGFTIEKDDTKCSICLSWYENNDDLRILPCSHHFHLQCADEWFKITATCPLCVRPVNPSIPSRTTAPDSNV